MRGTDWPEWNVRAPGGACVQVEASSAVAAVAFALDELGLIGDPAAAGAVFEVRPVGGGESIEVVIQARSMA